MLRSTALFLVALLFVSCSEAPQPEAAAPTLPQTSAATDEPADAPARSARPKPLIDLSEVDASPKPSAGTLTFERMIHDFGAVDDTKPLEVKYRFTNTGTGPIDIVTVKASCGCMTTELAKLRFEPGESEVIELAWEPKGRGRQTKTIDVVTTSEANPRVTLRATADVTQVVTISPIPTRFGDVPVGQGSTLRLFADSIDPDVVLLGVKSSNRQVQAAYLPGPAAGDADHAWVIDLTVSPDAPKGRLFAKLTLDIEAFSKQYGTRNRYSMEHNLSGNVVGKLKAEPHAFLVGRVQPKGSVKYSISLMRMDGEPFEILDANIVGVPFDGLSVTPTPLQRAGMQGYRLDLAGDVGGYLGRLSGTVNVTTNVPEDASMSFLIMGVVGAAPK